jgi:hypothetical protein
VHSSKHPCVPCAASSEGRLLGEFVELGKFRKGNILGPLVRYKDMRTGLQRWAVASEQENEGVLVHGPLEASFTGIPKYVLEGAQRNGVLSTQILVCVRATGTARDASHGRRRLESKHGRRFVAQNGKLFGRKDSQLHGGARIATAHHAMTKDGRFWFTSHLALELATQASPRANSCRHGFNRLLFVTVRKERIHSGSHIFHVNSKRFRMRLELLDKVRATSESYSYPNCKLSETSCRQYYRVGTGRQ